MYNMFRGGRGNKRRHDEYSRNARPDRSNRPHWEEEFDYEVRQLKQNAIHQYGNERGIPVLSFKFIGERQIRDVHQAINIGRVNGFRDRITPRPLSNIIPTTADGSDRVTKRQKKGKETTADPAKPSNKQESKEDDNDKIRKAKLPKEDKATVLKRFDNELDDYFSDNKGKEAKDPKKEDKPEVIKKSQEKEAVKPKNET